MGILVWLFAISFVVFLIYKANMYVRGKISEHDEKIRKEEKEKYSTNALKQEVFDLYKKKECLLSSIEQLENDRDTLIRKIELLSQALQKDLMPTVRDVAAVVISPVMDKLINLFQEMQNNTLQTFSKLSGDNSNVAIEAVRAVSSTGDKAMGATHKLLERGFFAMNKQQDHIQALTERPQVINNYTRNTRNTALILDVNANPDSRIEHLLEDEYDSANESEDEKNILRVSGYGEDYLPNQFADNGRPR